MDACNEHAFHSKLRIGARLIYHVTAKWKMKEPTEEKNTQVSSIYIYIYQTTAIDNEFESI